MKINYLPFKPKVASVRLRAYIPAMEMVSRGVELGDGGIFIAMKHSFTWSDLPKHEKLVFDVCDDHFHNHLSDHYRYGCEIADAITCNSEVMKNTIRIETGREATIINEPYESDERVPSIGDELFWFGHNSNLKDVERLMTELDRPIVILTNDNKYTEWSKEAFDRQMAKECLVVIPTGKSMAKSENRMVESVRNGKFVCSEFLPAYEPFWQFFEPGSMGEQIKRAIANPGESLKRISAAQDYIRDKYSPTTIAKQWITVLEGL